jgi:hypothetical protein
MLPAPGASHTPVAAPVGGLVLSTMATWSHAVRLPTIQGTSTLPLLPAAMPAFLAAVRTLCAAADMRSVLHAACATLVAPWLPVLPRDIGVALAAASVAHPHRASSVMPLVVPGLDVFACMAALGRAAARTARAEHATPEQRAAIATLIDEWHTNMHKMFRRAAEHPTTVHAPAVMHARRAMARVRTQTRRQTR